MKNLKRNPDKIYLFKIFIPIFLFLTGFSVTGQNKNLQELINNSFDGDTIYLTEGTYIATPENFTEEFCGNCINHNTLVNGTAGFVVQDKSLHIRGNNSDEVVLITNAGYGLFFVNSNNSSVSGVTIGGCKRDTSSNATNGSIVLRNSNVLIENCTLSNDTVRKSKTPIAGISGIVLRENSNAVIKSNRILNNTWDGIALYRGSSAVIEDNIIKTGRGAGIGITWDARAIILRNEISGFWKGIGTFGNSYALVKNNSVYNNLGWGIVISGNSIMILENNVITRNGNCGVAPWADSNETASGVITNNIISDNGWRKEWVCPQVGLWMNADSSRFIFSYNNVWNNLNGNYLNIENLTGHIGNISIEPDFISAENFHLKHGLLLRPAGKPSILNKYGTRSHIGIDGGPDA